MADTLTSFYNGKTIFLTGAAGFIGAFFLEILLRCFPGIRRIYIILRPKRGVEPQRRKEFLFKKKILMQISENYPELKEKVHVVCGDVSQPNLGMSDEDVRKVCEEVTIFFHGAANVSFSKPYREISLQNAKGTINVIDLCRKLKKLEVLVYTSTAYANCHIHPKEIKEKVYTLPLKTQVFLEAMEDGTEEYFAELVSSLNLKWPNTYTFSKCLAENVLLEKAADLPVAIVRPSIVMGAWKGVCCGGAYLGTGLNNFFIAKVKGFSKVVHADKDTIFDAIPVDIVVNTHIVSAWSVATGRCPSMFVVNCTSSDVLKLHLGKYIKDIIKLTQKFPVPKSFDAASVQLINNTYMYKIASLYHHYIPAAVTDIFLRFKRQKLRLVKVHSLLDNLGDQLYYFLSTTFDFQTDNFHGLSKLLQPAERELVYTDIGASFVEMIQDLPKSYDLLDWQLDKMTQKERQQIAAVNSLVKTIMKILMFTLLSILLYVIISKLIF